MRMQTGDGHNAWGLRAHDGGGVELNVYAESFVTIDQLVDGTRD